ncbi:MAG: hypothetical protein FWG66_04290 [Spirochaetes bacterium]|nr:hypothetical protein [Spirochaetota bacterium]
MAEKPPCGLFDGRFGQSAGWGGRSPAGNSVFFRFFLFFSDNPLDKALPSGLYLKKWGVFSA